MPVRLKVYNWLQFIQSALLPGHCLLCGMAAADGRLCAGCRADLPRIHHPCPRCGIETPVEVNTYCGECQRHPPPYDRTLAPFRYGPPLDRLILDLKFNGRLAIAPLLGGLLAEAVAGRADPLPTLLLPVPLHRQRLRERGFNQALLLADEVSRRWGIPVAADLCQRTQPTVPQARLSGAARRRNLRNAFACNDEVPRHVAIIDDVMTTGTTVGALAKVLKKRGAEVIEVWCLARAE